MMRPARLVLSTAAVLATLTMVAAAQDVRGNLARGRHLAERWCSSCHRMNTDAAPSRHGVASFVEVAQLPSTTALSLLSVPLHQPRRHAEHSALVGRCRRSHRVSSASSGTSRAHKDDQRSGAFRKPPGRTIRVAARMARCIFPHWTASLSLNSLCRDVPGCGALDVDQRAGWRPANCLATSAARQIGRPPAPPWRAEQAEPARQAKPNAPADRRARDDRERRAERGERGRHQHRVRAARQRAPRVRITKITSTCVASDSMNQPVWNSAAPA